MLKDSFWGKTLFKVGTIDLLAKDYGAIVCGAKKMQTKIFGVIVFGQISLGQMSLNPKHSRSFGIDTEMVPLMTLHQRDLIVIFELNVLISIL